MHQRRGRFGGPPPRAHQHTNGLFALHMHTSRVATCCDASLLNNGSGSSAYALTAQFLSDFTTEVRTVVGSSLFATIGRGNPLDVGEPTGTCTENPYFVLERGTTATVAAGASASAAATSGYVVFKLRVKDSRLSAALFAAVRKHSFVVLTDCRIMLDAATAAAATADDADGTARMNMDADLYAATRAAMATLPLAMAVAAASAANPTSSTTPPPAAAVADLQTMLQDHAAFLGSVKYAAVYTEPGSGVASPFACLLLILFDLRVTPEELVVLAKHQNRYLRALALYYARYAYPLESLAAVFAPSVDDGTVIACSGDFSVTRSMATLCKMLLVDDDVDEAWLPTYSKWWQRIVLTPMMATLHAHREASARAAATVRQQRHVGDIRMGEGGDRRDKRGRGDDVDDDDGAAPMPSHAVAAASSSKGGKSTLMGFRSALDFALFVDQARTLAASDNIQRLLASAGGGDDEDDDEEAAWARKHNPATPGASAADNEQVPAANLDPTTTGVTSRGDGGAKGPTTSTTTTTSVTRGATANVHKIAASHAQRAIVELLGPDAPRALRRGDPVYLSF